MALTHAHSESLQQVVTNAAACRQDVKELKVRPGTDVHDYEVRLRAAQKFLAKVRTDCIVRSI